MTLSQGFPDTSVSALLYARVSDTRQKTHGGGLQSQEHRCRQYAATKGYEVAAAFTDDFTGGGDFMKRPGMKALLRYLDEHPGQNFVVIFDDLKRFARDTVFHLKLRQEFRTRGATVECLNFTFEDTPEGAFVETILAAQGELEREQNRRQVIQKMKARVEKGYYVWNVPPRGYWYETKRGEGRVLVRDEPLASIIQEALEGFASGRFETQVEVKRFLESQPDYPKCRSGGHIRNQHVNDMLTNVTYAGYVEAKCWDVALREGQHEGLISLTTFEKIQERLADKAKAPARKDISEDFPLRGFILCDDCSNPLTACWSKSKTGKKYPYYMCAQKGCESYRKSIRRDQLEGDFEALLQNLTPAKGVFEIAKAMFADAWNQRLEQVNQAAETLHRKLGEIETNIGSLLERILDASNPRVISAYEDKISELERQKLLTQDQVEQSNAQKYPFEESFELACRFLANPYELWKNKGLGGIIAKRVVLRLVFLEGLAYSRKEGVRTP